MNEHLGVGWASTVLGFITLAVTAVVMGHGKGFTQRHVVEL